MLSHAHLYTQIHKASICLINNKKKITIYIWIETQIKLNVRRLSSHRISAKEKCKPHWSISFLYHNQNIKLLVVPLRSFQI